MTTPSTARKAGPFTGNGSQTAWPFTFKVFAAADVKVTATDANGDEVLLVLNTDYTVSLNANQETSPGGTVTYALASGRKLSIVGDLDYDQPLDLPSGGNYSPTALENQLDRTVMQIQQLKEEVDRAAKVPATSDYPPEQLTADLIRLGANADNIDTVAENIASVNVVAADLSEPVSEINTVAASIANVNAVGGSIASVNTVAGVVSDIPTVAANVADITNFADVYYGPQGSDPTTRNDSSARQIGDLYFNTGSKRMRVFDGTTWAEASVDAPGTYTVDRFSGNGSTTAFTLSVTPISENNTQVYIGGVYQQKDQYSVTGTTLTFASAPPSGTNNIEVLTAVTMAYGATDAANVAYGAAGVGAVTRTATDKLRETVSIADFGASPSASGSANRAAIVAALAASQSVYAPPGIYTVTGDTITIPDGTEFFGAGKYATTINFTPNGDKDCFVIGWYVTLRDMKIRDNYASGGNCGTLRLQSLTNAEIPTNVGGNDWTSPAVGGLSYKNTLRRLVLENGHNYNIYGVNLAYIIIDDVRAVLARGAAGNLYIWGKGGANMPASTSVKVFGGEYTASYAGPGIALENTTDSVFIGAIAEGNYGRGALLTGCARITFQSSYLENNFALGAAKGDGDLVVVNSSKITYTGGHILGNNSNNAVAASGNTDCALLGTEYYVLGGAPHTLSVDAGWVVSSNAIGIVQYGAANGGNWVKYADGTAVFTKKVTLSNIAISTASGNIFVQGTPQADTDFPAIFASDGALGFQFFPAIHVMHGSGGQAIWPVSTGASAVNNAIRYRLACASSQASVTVDVYITLTGRWK